MGCVRVLPLLAVNIEFNAEVIFSITGKKPIH
jgi:hypothetical protein